MAERYSRALESSHLEVDVEHPGDVDVLIASGWVKPSLGSDLLRTRSEYDSVNKRELACAADSLVSRVVVLSSLSSLDTTKRHVAGFAIQMATITKFDREPEEVLRIAAKALDVWLDPICHQCTGRGHSGAYGAPLVLCKPCGGSGSRRYRLASSEADHQFGKLLLTRFDEKVEGVANAMRKFLRK